MGAVVVSAVLMGDPPFLDKEKASAKQVENMVKLCQLLDERGGLFTIENPRDSLVFHCSAFKRLCAAVSVHTVDFEQCAYGLKLPGSPPNEFCLKRT